MGERTEREACANACHLHRPLPFPPFSMGCGKRFLSLIVCPWVNSVNQPHRGLGAC